MDFYQDFALARLADRPGRQSELVQAILAGLPLLRLGHLGFRKSVQRVVLHKLQDRSQGEAGEETKGKVCRGP